MDRIELEKQTQSIRTLLQNTYSRISAMQSKYIPSPDMSVRSAGDLISQEQYDVVVCGEVKKGKSSFINALMGDNVLPTNTQVATSQVFRIINSDVEEYHLVFNDGQRQRINKAELSKYGSQIDADLMGEPILKSHQLEYIEVKHPIPSLPKSVALVDTPGIGALYAAHEQITRNYLENASAVIFILDPKNPIVTKEREFIESALKQTNQIMFVMTKADNYDENVIATMISRNEEILAPYAKQTAMGRISIQPVSSTLLFDATKDKDELFYEMSQFEAIKDTLLKLIYSTVGFGISAEVFNSFTRYNTRVMQALKELRVSASSQQDSKQLIAKKMASQQEFAQEWGANGAKLREILTEIKEKVEMLENEAQALFSQSNSIYRDMADEIENLSSAKEAKELSKRISSTLVCMYGNVWKVILDKCERDVEKILIKYNAKLGNIDAKGSIGGIDEFHPKKRSFADKIFSARKSFFTGSFVATVLAVPLAAIAAPLAALGGLIGIGVGIASKRDAELKRLKQELEKHLRNCHSQIYDNFLVKTEDGRTLLQTAKKEILEQGKAAIQQIYEQHKNNLDKQLHLLEEQAKASEEARKQQLQELDVVEKQWSPIVGNLKQAENLLKQMEQLNKVL
jgi:GTPase SAR1 family protein/flagellar biosynthesis regulator FlaF